MGKLMSFFVGFLFLTIIFSSSVVGTSLNEANNNQVKLNTSRELIDSIEFNGTCNMFFHFLYRTRQNTIINPTKNIVKTGSSIIFFQNSEIYINGEHLGQNETGILLLVHYRGEYELNYNKHSLTIDGRAWYTNII